ncbi:Oidioi.mRNA.OKI2018_I69.PAR.g9111.t1.cds [Oikopleura dioica]|uniref:Oidioi.mRNA.OKI2018_I69.PAR.g9111.t1.cds n=1 Tax=Oikopleura dioica TaxID=34765 RepID=A0ABN7RJ42_OIKDI|nr:Oidioi.mRNA.OKI2018_I69.PAR.g9111.t1.cds [Oikopleura dioica]
MPTKFAIVTSEPLPDSIDLEEKGNEMLKEVTYAIKSFMGPGTMLDHFKVIPPKQSNILQFLAQVLICSFSLGVVIFTGFKCFQGTRTFRVGEKRAVVIGYLMTLIIPMVDVYPGLYLWYSYTAYNSMYSYDWNFAISFVLLYFPIAEALNLCVKSYFLVITVHQKYPPQWIFLCSGIAERIEILVIILPKLFMEAFLAALHCEFIGWFSFLILIVNVLGLLMSSSLSICSSPSILYDPKLTSIDDIARNKNKFIEEEWCGTTLSEWFQPRMGQCVKVDRSQRVSPLPFGPQQNSIYGALPACANPLEIIFACVLLITLVITLFYLGIMIYDIRRVKRIAFSRGRRSTLGTIFNVTNSSYSLKNNSISTVTIQDISV